MLLLNIIHRKFSFCFLTCSLRVLEHVSESQGLQSEEEDDNTGPVMNLREPPGRNRIIKMTLDSDDDDDDNMRDCHKYSDTVKAINIESSSAGSCNSNDSISSYDIQKKSMHKRQIAVEHYQGEESTPVYEWATRKKSAADVLKLLLKPSKETMLCKKVPNGVAHNVSFLLDVKLLESTNDWKCDDMGSWKNNGVQRKNLLVRDGEVFSTDGHDDYSEQEGDVYHILKRIYYKNKSSPDLKKIASFIEG